MSNSYKAIYEDVAVDFDNRVRPVARKLSKPYFFMLGYDNDQATVIRKNVISLTIGHKPMKSISYRYKAFVGVNCTQDTILFVGEPINFIIEKTGRWSSTKFNHDVRYSFNDGASKMLHRNSFCYLSAHKRDGFPIAEIKDADNVFIMVL